MQKYEELFPAFSGSRECTLMKKLLDAHEEQNIDSYTEAVKEYDTISRLDQWLTTMLLRIKKTIQGMRRTCAKPHPAPWHLSSCPVFSTPAPLQRVSPERERGGAETLAVRPSFPPHRGVSPRHSAGSALLRGS